MSLINTQVQPFKNQAFHNGKFVEITEATLKGKWNVFIFMPAAFTFNCPTEIEDAADNYAAFQKAGAEVYIITTDTHFSHKVWHETSRCLVPHFVRKVRVGGDDVHLSAGFLESGVVVSSVFDFCGAVEGERGGHEDEHVPLALEGRFGDFNELAVVEGLVFERLNLCVDQGHGVSLGWFKKTIE